MHIISGDPPNILLLGNLVSARVRETELGNVEIEISQSPNPGHEVRGSQISQYPQS